MPAVEMILKYLGPTAQSNLAVVFWTRANLAKLGFRKVEKGSLGVLPAEQSRTASRSKLSLNVGSINPPHQ